MQREQTVAQAVILTRARCENGWSKFAKATDARGQTMTSVIAKAQGFGRQDSASFHRWHRPTYTRPRRPVPSVSACADSSLHVCDAPYAASDGPWVEPPQSRFTLLFGRMCVEILRHGSDEQTAKMNLPTPTAASEPTATATRATSAPPCHSVSAAPVPHVSHSLRQ